MVVIVVTFIVAHFDAIVVFVVFVLFCLVLFHVVALTLSSLLYCRSNFELVWLVCKYQITCNMYPICPARFCLPQFFFILLLPVMLLLLFLVDVFLYVCVCVSVWVCVGVSPNPPRQASKLGSHQSHIYKHHIPSRAQDSLYARTNDVINDFRFVFEHFRICHWVYCCINVCVCVCSKAYRTTDDTSTWLSILFGGLSMLSKETGITVFVVNITYDLYRCWPSLKRTLVDVHWMAESQQCYRRLSKLLISMGILLIIRLALLQGSFPKFSQQDNPTAYHPSFYVR